MFSNVYRKFNTYYDNILSKNLNNYMILNNQCFTYISTIIFDLVKKYTNIDFYIFIYDDEKINNNQYNTFNILYTQNKLTKYTSITHICNKNKIFMDDKEFNNIYEILSFFDKSN